MDMLGGSPDVRLLPDSHSVHLSRFLSKPVSIVRCNNPRFALLFRNQLPAWPSSGQVVARAMQPIEPTRFLRSSRGVVGYRQAEPA
jgi:hypothetical protein